MRSAYSSIRALSWLGATTLIGLILWIGLWDGLNFTSINNRLQMGQIEFVTFGFPTFTANTTFTMYDPSIFIVVQPIPISTTITNGLLVYPTKPGNVTRLNLGVFGGQQWQMFVNNSVGLTIVNQITWVVSFPVQPPIPLKRGDLFMVNLTTDGSHWTFGEAINLFWQFG